MYKVGLMPLYMLSAFDATPFTRSELGWQLAGVAIGFILLSIGLAALALFLFRRKSTDFTLVYFSSFTILYAVRLLFRERIIRSLFPSSTSVLDYLDLFIDCFIVVPLALFLIQIVDPNWQKVLRWLIAAQIAFGLTRLLSSIFHVGEAAMKTGNNVFVIGSVALISCALIVAYYVSAGWVKSRAREITAVFLGLAIFGLFVIEGNLADLRLLPAHHNIESIGFFIFVCCLGYVTAQRTLAKEERLLQINKELQIANQIQSSILPRELPRLAGLEMAARYVPMSAVAGDFYDFLVVDQRRIGILVADVTGHGVPAALIASMLKVAFAAQTAYADDPARVLTGLNHALCGKFEEHFVTAAYVFVDLDKFVMRYAGAGHPPLLFTPPNTTRPGDAESREVEANGLMLGLFPDAAYSAVEIPLGAGDRILLYTDGILEAMNAAREEFGKLRLKKFLAAPSKSAGQFADALLLEIRRWSGTAAGRPQDDDITLLVLEVR
jgi:serine phosphatase RsbU (regulator of sigma subunit)